MNKIFLAITSMVITHFLQKVYRKITEKPTIDREEIYRQMKKAEYERRRAAARSTAAKMNLNSTPRDGAKFMATIDSIQQMRKELRPSNDQSDAMAMAPRRFI